MVRIVLLWSGIPHSNFLFDLGKININSDYIIFIHGKEKETQNFR